MRPAQVLEMQEDLRSRLTRPGGAEMFGAAFTPHEGSGPASGRALARLTGEHASLADAYRVTEEMCDTIAFAAAKLDDSDIFDRDLAPTPWGFVRFDKPLPMIDVRGLTMLANWLVWGPIADGSGTPGVFISLWNDMGTHPDEVALANSDLTNNPRALAVFGRWGFIGAEFVPQGDQVGAPLVEVPQQDIDRIVSEGHTPSDFTNALRYVHALWLMLGQTITDVRDETRDLTKKQAGRLRRAKIPGKVSVVRLRRVEYGRTHEESHVEWSRRWLVRGHWRWQPCGPGRKDRVRIWISPYAKNVHRTDLPLVVPTKVYSLDR